MRLTLNRREKEIIANEVKKHLRAWVEQQVHEEVKHQLNLYDKETVSDRLREYIKKQIYREIRGYNEILERLGKWRPIFVKLALKFPELAPDLGIAIDGFADLLNQEKLKGARP